MEGIFTLAHPIRNVRNHYPQIFILQEFEHYFKNGTKAKIPTEIKPPLAPTARIATPRANDKTDIMIDVVGTANLPCPSIVLLYAFSMIVCILI